MKLIKGLFFLLMLLVLSSLSYAITFESYLETIDMGEEKIHETIEIIANVEENQDSIKFSLIANILNLEVYLNDNKINCDVIPRVGASDINCPLSESIIGRNYIKIQFDSSYPLIKLDEKLMFRSSYNPIIETNNFLYVLKLPLGYVIPREEGKDESFFVSPEPDKIYSDGQRIILSWEKETLDEQFDVSTVTQKINGSTNTRVIILVFILVIAVILYFKRNKKEIIIKSLIENEKMIVDELKKVKNNVLWQKQLQIRTKLSKVKLSRVLKSLEARKVIEKESYGKTNKIKLVDEEDSQN